MSYEVSYHNYVADPETLRHANETRVVPLLRDIPGFEDSVIEFADEPDGRGYQCVWVMRWDGWESFMAKFAHPGYQAADAIVQDLFLLKSPETKSEVRPA